MDFKDQIERIVKELPPGCELFIPEEVSADIGVKDSELDQISQNNGCHTGFAQSFELTPDEPRIRIMRDKSKA